MKKQIGQLIILLTLLFFNTAYSQQETNNDNLKIISGLFSEDEIVPIKLSYSIKNLKRETNDSTYIESVLGFQDKNGSWQNIPIKLRARGNNRLKKCYFPPIKIKIKKSDSKGTIFKGQKTMKAVLPCLLESENDDNVIKEYLVYKLYEKVSPYHFKTRLVTIDFEQIKNSKTKAHQLKGFLIEDDKKIAKRFDGKVYDRFVHPLNQDDLTSVRNAFFQFMIGNTDFSQAYHHNVKLIYINKKMTPVPYDFDMSGFVDASYAVVSQIQGEKLNLTSVTDRKYRGFQRNEEIFNQVRNEFIANKTAMGAILDANKDYFEDSDDFETAKKYLKSFFDIIENDRLYKSQILNQLRKE
jgi:hypothetical protein